MGSALATSLLGIERPRVGLVNIGEEEGKGRELEKEAYAALMRLEGVNFIGNVEGRDLGGDAADVLVTDGFTGNVLLKTAEGAARLVQNVIFETLSQPSYLEAREALRPVLDELRERVNPETTGGAHLLGTKGVVVIAHGSSSRVAVANAVAMAAEGAAHGLTERIASGVDAGID
jgi:glycerol-3-phosphate acyltransferase PlsX